MVSKLKTKAVIFDFNGVLLNDEPVHCQLLQEMAAEQGVVLSRTEYYQTVIGFDDRESFEYLFRDLPQPLDIPALIAEKNQRYQNWIKEKHLFFPDAERVVKEVSKSHCLAICSGALRQEIEMSLDLTGLSSCFSEIVSANDVKRSKPDPEGYGMAFQKLKKHIPDLKKEECRVIEDTPAGIISAERAGLPVLGITHSVPRADLEVLHPLAIIDHLPELLKHL